MNALRYPLGTTKLVAPALVLTALSGSALAEAPAAPSTTPPAATPEPAPTGTELAEETSEPEALDAPTVTTSPLPESSEPGFDTSSDLLAPLNWREQSGQGVSFAYESGLWGSRWEQGLRFGVPFGRHFAVNLRALYTSDTSIEDDVPYTADLGGRLDFIGRSQPFLNLVRLYGGGGMQVFEPVFATEGRSTQIGGGGHFGFEFFCTPHYSFFLEVGGQGGKPSAGATVLAGMAFYPWTE